MDTVTAFFRAYYDDDGMLQYRPMSKLARRYGCSRWFVIDFAGCLPVNYLSLVMNEETEAAGSGLRTNKALRMLRLFKLLRLLRLARIHRCASLALATFPLIFSYKSQTSLCGSTGLWTATRRRFSSSWARSA